MESFLFDALSKQIIASGIPAAMLLVAVWWFHQKWSAAQLKAEAMQKEFLDSLNKERTERIALIEQRCEDSEKRHDECQKDRSRLHEQILQFYREASQTVRNATTASAQSH